MTAFVLRSTAAGRVCSAALTCVLTVPLLLLDGSCALGVAVSVRNQSAIATIFGEDVLSANTSHIRRRALALPPGQRYRALIDWVLPNSHRPSFRFRGEFSQTHPAPDHSVSGSQQMIVSPVLDLVEIARQNGQLQKLAHRVHAISASENSGQRQRAAILFLIAMSQQDADAIQRTLSDFAAFFEPFQLEEPERYWPELIVVSVAAGFPELGQTVQDLIVEFHKHRLQYFSAPQKDVFLDHARWLQGLQNYCIAQNFSRENLAAKLPLKQWTSVGYWEAKSRGHGKPVANWQLDGTSAKKIGGHELDHLMFRMPLRGNYQIECDYSVGADAGSTMMVAGVQLERIDAGIRFGSFRKDTDAKVFVPALSQQKKWNHFRADVRDGILKQRLNGRVALERKLHPEHDPWIALRSWRRGHCTLKNVRITGTPFVPDEINLTADPELSGWAPYFEEGFLDRGNWRQQESRGGNTIYGRYRPALAGTSTEKLLRYHRPMLEDGEIQYDFFCRQGETMVHPALDRCCFILHDDGVRIHWLTDREHDNTGADPDNLVKEPDAKRGSNSLPLMKNEWNTASLKLTNNIVQLSVNGVLVYERRMEAGNQRTFGLFHYADRTDAMIRNVTWKGEWPKFVPPLDQQELRGTETDLLDNHLADLPVALTVDFKDGVPPKLFDVKGDPKAIVQLPDGIRVSLKNSEGVTHLQSRFQVKGDFDIELQFRDLEIDRVPYKTTGIALVLFFDSQKHDNCGLYRRFQGYSNDGNKNQQRLLFAHKQIDPDGNVVYSGTPTAEESESGRIRMARHGATLTALYAEADSPFYRIVATRVISADAHILLPIHLLLQAPGNSSVSVVWEKLIIRSEEITEVVNNPHNESTRQN